MTRGRGPRAKCAAVGFAEPSEFVLSELASVASHHLESTLDVKHGCVREGVDAFDLDHIVLNGNDLTSGHGNQVGADGRMRGKYAGQWIVRVAPWVYLKDGPFLWCVVLVKPPQNPDLCGTGLIGLFLLPHVQSVTGADNSTGMLEVLRGKIASDELENMEATCRACR